MGETLSQRNLSLQQIHSTWRHTWSPGQEIKWTQIVYPLCSGDVQSLHPRADWHLNSMGRQQACQAISPSVVQTQHGMEQQSTWNHRQQSWLVRQELSWTPVFSGLGTGWKLWELFQAGVSSKETFKLFCSGGAHLTGLMAFSVHFCSCIQH